MKKKDSREDWFWSLLLGAVILIFLAICFVIKRFYLLMCVSFIIADLMIMLGAFINRKE